MSYIKDPTEIYRGSFAAIRREVDLSPFPKQLHNLVLRMGHAVAQPEITENIAWRGDAATAALSAINEGAAILADANGNGRHHERQGDVRLSGYLYAQGRKRTGPGTKSRNHPVCCCRRIVAAPSGGCCGDHRQCANGSVPSSGDAD